MDTKKKIITILILSLLTACNIKSEPKDIYIPKMSKNDQIGKTQNTPNNVASKSRKELKPFKVADPKTGTHFYTIWYPPNWEQITNNKEWTFKGPNGIKISGEFGQFFTFGSYDGYGYNQRQPMDIHAIIQEFFMPNAHKYQRKLVKVYEVPEVAQTEHQYRSQLWQYAPTEKITKTYAIEWEDPNQMKFITLLNVIIDHSQMGSGWAYYGRFLQAESSHFESAKAAFIRGMGTKVYNQQWIVAYNNNEMQKANISHNAHQRRMAAINARGNAISNTGKIYSDILDINHSGYLSRSNMTDHGHTKTISGIQETVTIANHNTGEHYSVPMGNNHYWVSNQGTYFGTDNSLYNPNTDKNMHDLEWSKFEVEN